ncbi:MAG: hypothetical protein R6X22_05095 [Gemmatimonadota bacterium]
MRTKSRTTLVAALAALTAVPAGPAAAQEAEPSRPCSYLNRVFGATKEVDIESLEDPTTPKVIKTWRIEVPGGFHNTFACKHSSAGWRRSPPSCGHQSTSGRSSSAGGRHWIRKGCRADALPGSTSG